MQMNGNRKVRNRVRQSRGDNIFDGAVVFLLLFAILIVAYPLIYVVSASFSSTEAVMAGEVWLYPVRFSLKAYETVFRYDAIMTG